MFICLLVLLLAMPPETAKESRTVTLILKANGLNTPARENGRTEYELADVNGDGHPDIITMSDHGNPGGGQLGIMVWFGDGLGNWTVAKEGNFGYGGCALGDLNNDGTMDVAWGIHHNYGSGGFGDMLLGAALGNGTGNGWVPWGDGLGENGESWGMFATDLADSESYMQYRVTMLSDNPVVSPQLNSVTVSYDPLGVEGNTGFGLRVFPSPVASVATVSLTLPEPAEYTVAVYSLDGRLVGTVADGSLPAGESALQWDASSVPSGVYFVRLSGLGLNAGVRLVVVR